VDTAYPGLASSVLTFATLADLPKGTLLESGSLRLTETDLASQMDKAPPEVRKQLERNRFYLLEQLASQRLVVELARQQTPGASTQPSQQAQGQLVQAYFEKIVGSIQVADAEIKDFYENNKDMCGGASLDSVKGQLSEYVLQQKQQAAAEEHVRTLGKQTPIQVNATWVAAQAQLARDNPVDKARSSGKPSMVDFGASGCRPCDMMTPILKDLERPASCSCTSARSRCWLAATACRASPRRSSSTRAVARSSGTRGSTRRRRSKSTWRRWEFSKPWKSCSRR
jgi:hypothetical protein